MARTVMVCKGCQAELHGESQINTPPVGSDRALARLAPALGWYVGTESLQRPFEDIHLCPSCLESHTPNLFKIGDDMWLFDCSCGHYGNDIYGDALGAKRAYERHLRHWLPMKVNSKTTPGDE